MNRNVGIQNQGRLVWNGAPVQAVDIRRHTDFGFVFDVRADLAADTIFKIMAHDPSDVDICAPGPARDVPEVVICQPILVSGPAPTTEIILPAGTPAGSVCSATVPCYPGAFVSIEGVSGDTANVWVVAILSGPMF